MQKAALDSLTPKTNSHFVITQRCEIPRLDICSRTASKLEVEAIDNENNYKPPAARP